MTTEDIKQPTFEYDCFLGDYEKRPKVEFCEFKAEVPRHTDIKSDKLEYGDKFVFINLPGIRETFYRNEWVLLSFHEVRSILDSKTEFESIIHQYSTIEESHQCDFCRDSISGESFKIVNGSFPLSFHVSCFDQLKKRISQKFRHNSDDLAADLL